MYFNCPPLRLHPYTYTYFFCTFAVLDLSATQAYIRISAHTYTYTHIDWEMEESLNHLNARPINSTIQGAPHKLLLWRFGRHRLRWSGSLRVHDCNIYTHIYTHIHTLVHQCKQKPIGLYVCCAGVKYQTSIYTYKCPYIYLHTYTYWHYTYTYRHLYKHVYISKLLWWPSGRVPLLAEQNPFPCVMIQGVVLFTAAGQIPRMWSVLTS